MKVLNNIFWFVSGVASVLAIAVAMAYGAKSEREEMEEECEKSNDTEIESGA